MSQLKNINVKGLEFTPYILRDEIKSRVQELAIGINTDYENKVPLFLSILNGSFMFTSDLMKQIQIDSEVKFVNLSSYDGLKSSGKIIDNINFGKWITDRHIIIIEDIVDTGLTMNHLLNKLLEWDPASIEISTLFVKRDCMNFDINLRYVGFEIPNHFIVGYGLDYDGFGRNYQDVYQKVD